MKEPAIAAAEHMAACEARTAARKEERAAELAANKARHRALLDEFLTENPELRPDA